MQHEAAQRSFAVRAKTVTARAGGLAKDGIFGRCLSRLLAFVAGTPATGASPHGRPLFDVAAPTIRSVRCLVAALPATTQLRSPAGGSVPGCEDRALLTAETQGWRRGEPSLRPSPLG